MTWRESNNSTEEHSEAMNARLAMHERIRKLESSQQAAWALLNLNSTGLVILDADRNALFCNDAAQEIIRSTKLLKWRGERLYATQPDMETWLNRKLKSLCLDTDAPLVSNQPCGKRSWDGKRQVHLVATPLPCDDDCQSSTCCALFLSTSELDTRHIQSNLQSMYGLTQREAEVAGLIVSGHSALEIAESLSLKPSTVQTHIKHLHLKMGVSRQSELIRVGLFLNIGLP